MKKNILNCITVLIILLLAACGQKPDQNKESEIDSVRTVVKTEQASNFFFIGSYFGKPAVYNYNLLKDQWKVVWATQKESVIDLSHSSDNKYAYFLTAKKYGKGGSLPFVNKVRLYRIDNDSVKGNFISNIGSGIQVLTRWNDNDNFEVTLSSVDKKIASYVNVNKQVYNKFGKLIDDIMQTYDLTTVGFPELLPERISTLSKNGRQGISEVGDSVYLRTLGQDSLHFISALQFPLNKVGWSAKDNYAFISTIKSVSGTYGISSTSELFIYDVTSDSMVTSWSGNGAKNFLIIGDLLIFDDGVGYNSLIRIYDYVKKETRAEIKIRGGCGLNYLSKN